jgi:toxin FitB
MIVGAMSMYLIDTNVVSEFSKRARANPGVVGFMQRVATEGALLFLSVVTVGELRQGIDTLRLRGDVPQAQRLAAWYEAEVAPLGNRFLPVDATVAETWGALRARDPHNPLDKLIAATALVYGLTVVTRNERDFLGTGAAVFNPFS